MQIIASHVIKVHASADASVGENRVSKEENWLKRYVSVYKLGQTLFIGLLSNI